MPLQVLFPGEDGVQFRDAKVAALKAAQDAGQVGTTFPARFLLTAIGGGIPGAVMPGVGCKPAGPGVIMLRFMTPGGFMGLEVPGVRPCGSRLLRAFEPFMARGTV